jgi:hypothetical protein
MQNSDFEPLTHAENAEFDRLQSCFTEAQYDAVERALCLRAYVIGCWVIRSSNRRASFSTSRARSPQPPSALPEGWDENGRSRIHE